MTGLEDVGGLWNPVCLNAVLWYLDFRYYLVSKFPCTKTEG